MDVLQNPLLIWALRVFLSLPFATAAISKLTGIEQFYGVVRNFRLLPDRPSWLVAMTLPIVELLIAAGLILSPLAVPAALTATALPIVFGVAIAVLCGRSQIDCGGFRNGMKQTIPG